MAQGPGEYSCRIFHTADYLHAAALLLQQIRGREEDFFAGVQIIWRLAPEFTEAESAALQESAVLLERLRDLYSRKATDAGEAEEAFLVRVAAAKTKAAKIFAGWRLDVAGWLALMQDREGAVVYTDYGSQAAWRRECTKFRAEFLEDIAVAVATSKGAAGVSELMRTWRVRAAANAANRPDDFDQLVRWVTKSIAAR